MTLLSIAAARALIQTPLSDFDLGTVIDCEERGIIAAFDAHYSAQATIAEAVEGGATDIYLRRRIGSVASITEARAVGGPTLTLAASTYYVWGNQGRITRLPDGSAWGRLVTVTYTPADDSALRKQVLIELVRIAVNQRTPRKASGYGYTVEDTATAQDWQQMRDAQIARLRLPSL